MQSYRWYKDKVFYQIWPRSFKDGDGDGMGDLWGVLEKLDYIKSLGCEGIWFSPLYPSPGADCGYDISDYMDIDPEFGGMEAFKKVLDGAHERGMKVIMDLVVNHTSDEHEWFQKSRQRIDPYTDYYIWRPGKRGMRRPNNWDSLFEGKAWAWDDQRKEYYLHLFARKQPDLNMDNPLVREEVKKILRFWLDMGVDGFREDVITFISKPEGLPNDHILPVSKGILKYNHGPHVHEYLQEFRQVLDEYDSFAIGEAPMTSPKTALEYIAESKVAAGTAELDAMIQFETACADCQFSDYRPKTFSLPKLKRAFTRWQKKLYGQGWNLLYLENHDHPRVVSRYGDPKYWKQSAKTLAACYLFQQGTPFVYQGQEIGMLNWEPVDAAMYEDVQTRWQYEHTKGDEVKRLKKMWRCSRDSARTPMQWNGKKYAGFSEEKPWFHVNPNYTIINVEQQEKDPDSILNFYRKAIELRQSLPCVRFGDYKLRDKSSDELFMYTRQDSRQRILVVCSFSENPVRFKPPKNYHLVDAELVLQNYPDAEGTTLQPWECRDYLWK